MSETNVFMLGNAGAVALTIPAGASFKPATKGFIAGCWIRTPAGGYEAGVTYGCLTRNGGGTGGADGYVKMNQTCTTITAQMRNGGTDFIPLLTLTKPSGDWQGKTLFVALIATAGYHHLVVCEPGGTYDVQSFASSLAYNVNLAASDLFTRIGAGTGAASYGHYGPVEEAFLILGTFPETAGVPDATLLQDIANGVQDIGTLDGLMTGTPVKKWRYRMLQQDMLTDAFGVAGALVPENTTVDKFNLSCHPLRPIALKPNASEASTAQVVCSTPLVAATATANIKIEGGTYTGITPAAIHARLRKEDGTVLAGFDWTVVDPAPAVGIWAASQFSNVPMTAGWLTVDFKAVDGGGATLGDIVSGHWKSAGFHFMPQGQSQIARLMDLGTSLVIPSGARLQLVDTISGGAFRAKRVTAASATGRITNAMRQVVVETDALYPGVPVTVTSVAVGGQSLNQWHTGGAYAAIWANAKTFFGHAQSFFGYFVGHSNADAAYQTTLNTVIAKRDADFGVPLRNMHEITGRNAGVTLVGASDLNIRQAIWARILANPTTDVFATNIPAVRKMDTNDNGGHDAPNNVGHGRRGAGIAWALMGPFGARLINDEPVTLVSVTRQAGGTEDVLNFGPVN